MNRQAAPRPSEWHDDAADELGYGKGLKVNVFVGGGKSETEPKPEPKAPAVSERDPEYAAMPEMAMSYQWVEPAWKAIPTFVTPTAPASRLGGWCRAHTISVAKRGRQISYLRQHLVLAK